MRLSRRRHDTHGVPGAVASALELAKGESIMGGARDVDSGVWLVETQFALALVDPGRGDSGEPSATVVWKRPWHDVDAGSWDPESSLLTVTWVHRGRPGQWRLGDEAVFLQTLRERVQASVVLSEELTLSGRRKGRAVIRQDLRTGDLLQQVVLGRGVPSDDEVSVAADRALTSLREQVGMPHP